MKYDRRENDRRKDRVNFMVVDREVKKETKGQTRFVVTREFGGTQTMQQAFEQPVRIFFALPLLPCPNSER